MISSPEMRPRRDGQTRAHGSRLSVQLRRQHERQRADAVFAGVVGPSGDGAKLDQKSTAHQTNRVVFWSPVAVWREGRGGSVVDFRSGSPLSLAVVGA